MNLCSVGKLIGLAAGVVTIVTGICELFHTEKPSTAISQQAINANAQIGSVLGRTVNIYPPVAEPMHTETPHVEVTIKNSNGTTIGSVAINSPNPILEISNSSKTKIGSLTKNQSNHAVPTTTPQQEDIKNSGSALVGTIAGAHHITFDHITFSNTDKDIRGITNSTDVNITNSVTKNSPSENEGK